MRQSRAKQALWRARLLDLGPIAGRPGTTCLDARQQSARWCAWLHVVRTASRGRVALLTSGLKLHRWWEQRPRLTAAVYAIAARRWAAASVGTDLAGWVASSIFVAARCGPPFSAFPPVTRITMH
jgi:hypothetical protein